MQLAEALLCCVPGDAGADVARVQPGTHGLVRPVQQGEIAVGRVAVAGAHEPFQPVDAEATGPIGQELRQTGGPMPQPRGKPGVAPRRQQPQVAPVPREQLVAADAGQRDLVGAPHSL